MIINLIDNNNNMNSITDENIREFKSSYNKDKIRIDGYKNNLIESINYNYRINSSRDYIGKNGYFVTASYSKNKLYFKNQKLSNENHPIASSNVDLSALVVYDFRDFHNRFTRAFTKDRNFMTLNPHPTRPITYCFLDAEGTKWGTRKDEYNNIHIHAIMVIPESMHEEFENTIRAYGNEWNMNHSCIVTMDIRRIKDYGLGDITIPYMFSYASKFISQNAKDLIFKVDQDFLPRYGKKNWDFYH